MTRTPKGLLFGYSYGITRTRRTKSSDEMLIRTHKISRMGLPWKSVSRGGAVTKHRLHSSSLSRAGNWSGPKLILEWL